MISFKFARILSIHKTILVITVLLIGVTGGSIFLAKSTKKDSHTLAAQIENNARVEEKHETKLPETVEEKNTAQEPVQVTEKLIKCLGADRNFAYVSQAVCDETRNYWSTKLGSFPTDPEEIITCLGADGKYSLVPRKTCEETNTFWATHSTTGSSQSSNISTNSSSNTDFVTVTPLSWGTTAMTGPYTLAPGLTNYTVVTPDGTTPTESSLTSHRYHHHTHVAVHNGRVWVTGSSGGTNEDASGQMVVAVSSGDGGATWSSPLLIVPSQSTFTASGSSYVNGTRITYPRSFVTYNGDLYLVSAIDDVLGTNNLFGSALVAVKCKDDGTIGPLFRVSSAVYTPQSGFAAINYDSTLGPPLFSSASLYGNWGGSSIGNTASDWLGWIQQSGETFVEPTTIDLNNNGTSLLRLWRKVTTVSSINTLLWSQLSTDSGATWTTLIATNIPNNPSEASGIRLSDGRIALVGNPRNVSVNRDPLYLAIFNKTTGLVSNVYAVRQGLSGTPTYSGNAKGGGAQYPGITSDGTNLWVSYSIAKESIGVTKIPLSGL